MADRRTAAERRRDRSRVLMNPTPEELEACKTLAPFMRAGLDGLERSRWRPGQWTKIEDLVAPIVVAVLVEVAKQLPLAEMTAALDREPAATSRGDRP
jgi:hypothetical protein